MAAEGRRELLHEGYERRVVLAAVLPPLGRSLRTRRLLLRCMQPRESLLPLLQTLDHTRAPRGGVPARCGNAAEALARRPRHPTVREEGDHVTATQRRVDEVEQGEDPPSE